MSEEVAEEAEALPEGPRAGADPVAIALALGGASQERADAFLQKQEAFIDDQRRHLHEQFKQLHLSIMEKWLGLLLRAATVIVGIAVAGGFGYPGKQDEAKAQFARATLLDLTPSEKSELAKVANG